MESYPLTALQKSMVHASVRAPRSGAYVLQDVCEWAGVPDAALLERAFQQLAQRHAALRTCIEAAAGEFRQRVRDEPSLRWQQLDWTGIAPDTRQDRLAEFLSADSERGFDFSEGVPLRFTLIRNPGGSSTVVWTLHHVLLDGRSLVVAWREWLALYDASIRGEAVRLDRARPFGEHVAAIDRQDLAQAERYWREYLAGLSQTTGYVTDRLRPALPPEPRDFAKESARVPDHLAQQLRELAARHRLTVNTLILGAWAILLSRYSGRADIVFGVTRAGRDSAGEMLGLLINTLPMRIAVRPDQALVPWLEQIREQWIAMREYVHTPLDRVSEWSGLAPGMPLFDSVLVYDHEPPGETLRKLGGEWLHRSVTRRQRTDSPVTLAAYGAPGLSLEIAYDARLFATATVAGMAGHLSTLLESFIAQPECRVGALTMIGEQEESWLVHGVNRTAVRFPREVYAHRLFEQQARRAPGNVALEDTAGSVSYDEANQRANRLARFLRQKGAQPEDVIALCMPRSPQAVIAVLAVLKAGAAFLPLDPALPQERLAALLADSRARFAIATDLDLATLSPAGCEVLRLDRLRDEIFNLPSENLDEGAAPDNAAYVIFTSGSTGRPKGAVLTHRALANHTLATGRVYGIAEADRRLQFAPIGTDVFVAEVFNYLCHGAALVFGPEGQRNSVREFLRVLDERRITITGIAASWWSEWVATISEEGFRLPPSLRAVIVGLERMNPAAYLAWKRAAGGRVRLFNAYGPTETSPTATIYEGGTSQWECSSYVPVGKPIANVKAYVLDNDRNHVPMGVAGELYIGGDGVARGYLHAPDLTARSFLPDPFSEDPDARLYKTGDLVFRLPDGNLVFLGRVDRQVKIRGFRIELEEIESVLARHPAVRQCAVVVHGGEGQERLVAYVSPAGSADVADGALRVHVARYLPDHMLPAAIVTLSELPLTAAGKIDRQSLATRDPGRQGNGRHFAEPSTETEKRLAALWHETLGVPRAGATDNFFELGGDSLRASRLIRLIDGAFGQQIPISTLFQAPTIARLAAILDNHETAAPSPGAAIPLQPHGSRLPLFCIAPVGDSPYRFLPLARQLGGNQPVFALPYPAFDGERIQPVEELARRVCQSIRAVRPGGPYLLGGFCFGGTIAFEAARQLQFAQEEVRLLVLFDAAAPGSPQLLRSPTPYRRRLRDALALARGRTSRALLRQAAEHLELAGRLMKRRVLARYTPQPASFPTVQFMVIDDAISGRILEDSRLGWHSLCPGGFHVHRVTGAHDALFQEQQCTVMAAALEEYLRNANSPLTLP